MDFARLLEDQHKYLFYPWVAQDRARPMCIEQAEGVWLTLNTGQRVLDFNSSIFNANLGHGHAGIRAAMQRASLDARVGHPALVHPEKAKLAKNLARIMPGDLKKTFLTLGGAEANENAVKIARMVTGRHKVMTRYRSYHGATLAMINYSGDMRRIPFDGTLTGIVRFPDHYLRDKLHEVDTIHLLEEMIQAEGSETIACLLFEVISGTNGVYILSKDYWKNIRTLCDKYGILLIADEILTGFGRTGTWFGVEHFGVVPDMITFGKGLTGGYAPLAGVTVHEKIARYFEDHVLWCGLTHYAHPFCCAVANAAIEAYESEKIFENVISRGEQLKKGLECLQSKHAVVGGVRSLGLLAALDLKETDEELLDKLLNTGIYCTVRQNMIILAPPLCVSSEELDEGLKRIESCL